MVFVDFVYAHSHNCFYNPCLSPACSSFSKPAGYRCDCNGVGYEINACVNNKICDYNPCPIGYLCNSQLSSGGNTFKCSCPDGHLGENCEIYNACYNDPCPQDTHCTWYIKPIRYTCSCGTSNCDCESNPCSQGFECSITTDGYTCTCPTGFTGENCNTYEGCSSNPCGHGTICNELTNPSRGYTCDCPEGYLGVNCSTYNACSSNPCGPATCVSTNPSLYTCVCPEGYLGDDCSIYNACFSNPCGSGTCYSFTHPSRYECTCPDGSSGGDCNTYNDACTSNPCRTGTCMSTNLSLYTCVCPEGYSGNDCSTYDDIDNPIVTCPGNIEKDIESTGQTTVIWNDPSVSDNIDTGLSAICTPPSGSSFNIGLYSVTCTATDNAGNHGSCIFTVHINEDVEIPIVTCPTAITIGTDTTVSTVSWDEPTVSDNVNTNLSATCTPSSGSSFNIGSTDVTCSATDTAGNVGRCEFKVSFGGCSNISSVPGYQIAVIAVLAICLMMCLSFLFYYRFRYSRKNRDRNSTMSMTNIDVSTSKPPNTDYEVPAPANVEDPRVAESRESVNYGYEDLHTYSSLEPAYTGLKQT